MPGNSTGAGHRFPETVPGIGELRRKYMHVDLDGKDRHHCRHTNRSFVLVIAVRSLPVPAMRLLNARRIYRGRGVEQYGSRTKSFRMCNGEVGRRNDPRCR